MTFMGILLLLLLPINATWADENGNLKAYINDNSESIDINLIRQHTSRESNITIKDKRRLWKSLYGLELDGKYEEYGHRNFVTTDNQEYATRDYVDYQYSLKLNLALFKDGLYESYNKYQIASKKDKVFESRQIDTLLQSAKSRMALFLRELQVEINYRYYKTLHTLYSEQMQYFQESYNNRILEHYKYSRLKMKAVRYQKYADIYQKHQKISITPALYALLKTIDSITLMPLDTLLMYAQRHSTLLNLKEAKIALLDTDKSYLDSLALNLYVKRSATDEIGRYDAIGMEVTLPLTMKQSQEDRIDKLKAQSEKVLLKESKKNLMLKLRTLYSNFKDIQKMIEVDKEEMGFYTEQIKDFEELKSKMSSGITLDPNMEILLTKEKILRNKYDILEKRLKLIALLYEIRYSANITSLSTLMERNL